MAIQDCIAKITAKSGISMSHDEILKAMGTVDSIIQDMKASKELNVSNTFADSVTGNDAYGKLAQQVMMKLRQDAELREFRSALNVVTEAKKGQDYSQLRANGFSPYDSVVRMMQDKFRTGTFSTESKMEGVRDFYHKQLVDTWDALGDKFAGFIQDPNKSRLLLMEINHEDTSKIPSVDPELSRLAKKGAEAWHKVSESMRQEFNMNGGNIGKLEGYDMPHDIHAQDKVAGNGRDSAAYKAYLETLTGEAKAKAILKGSAPIEFAKQYWIDRIAPMMDRTKMLDSLGRPIGDEQFKEMLSHSFDSIVTNGMNDSIPGEYKGGTIATRHAQHRQLFFKDADSMISYMKDFSDRSFMDLVWGHVSGMARDIAVIKDWGPNAEATYRTLRDTAVKEEANLNPTNSEKARQHGAELDMMWDLLNGRTKPVINKAIAKSFQVVSALNVAGKLGSSMFASLFGDRITNQAMLTLNNMDTLKFYVNSFKAMKDAGLRDDMRRAGFLPEYMRNALSRFGDDMISNTLVDKAGNVVMRISLMNAINEIPRGVFAMQLADTLGGMLRKFDSFSQAHAEDVHFLNSYGIGEADWKLWKLAELEDWGNTGHSMLTVDAIGRIPDSVIKQNFGDVNPQKFKTDAMQKLLGAINMEAKNAVVEPSMQDRPMWLQGLQRGTFGGEVVRSVWQFKSFPWSQFHRMWDIAASREGMQGKSQWIAALLVGQTLAGAMIQQTREMLSGKDPRNMNDLPFWGASFVQGGAMGIYGDFLYSVNQTRYGTGPLEIMAGPTVGTGLDALMSTLNAAEKARNGEETHLLAKYMTLAKGMTPGGNLWYTKAALDHIIFQNIQEQLSPGYLSSMESRTQSQYGQKYWWRPGELAPERAPDLESAIQ